jgi:NAD(P)-dependent dehydrogenase (short-subunit alcohol dehydrogenase family)
MNNKGLFDLTGKTAVITGGSRGLGLQIAQALTEQGARVLLMARKQDELNQAVAFLKEQGAIAYAQAIDLGKPDSIGAAAAQAKATLGEIDILVNNAGAAWGAAAEDHPFDAWLKLVNLNLNATFLLTQAVGNLSMIPRKQGKILTVASIAGLRGNPPGSNQTLAYNTTKGGLVNFTRALAGEWGRYNINVNALAPGFFPSKMTEATLDKVQERVIANTPLGRIGGNDDLKGAALLFCSEAGRHITGQILAVDGGVTAV